LNLPFEIWIGWRYTRAGRRARRNRFISFISAISTAGIALGVAALIVVLSVMNGFQREVRDRMLSVLPHIEVFSVSGALTDWQAVLAQARANTEVLAGAPYVSGQAMLARDDVLRGVAIRGIDPSAESGVSDLSRQMKQGALTDLRPGEFGLVLGSELARGMGLARGDKVAVIAPQGTVTPAGVVPRMRQFTVVGVFEAGHYEYDSTLAFMHVQDAAKLFRVEGVTGVRLRVADMQRAPLVAREIAATVSPDLLVRDWSRQNRTWFAAVQTEKRMMFLILTLIMAVAAFNLVSMLVMTVTDKQSDIAILRTFGATPASIRSIFVVQGWTIGLFGTLAGVLGGGLLALNLDVVVPAIEAALGLQFLPKDIYLISRLPSDPRIGDIGLIALVSVALSLAATLYPSWSASRVNPAEALRYE
jgi:lipoprotein-releasing system permease protein